VAYHLPLETKRRGLSIYVNVTCNFTILHVLIPRSTLGSITTPSGLHVDFIKCTHHICWKQPFLLSTMTTNSPSISFTTLGCLERSKGWHQWQLTVQTNFPTIWCPNSNSFDQANTYLIQWYNLGIKRCFYMVCDMCTLDSMSSSEHSKN
jgi:hypothetical protein